jgi:hypothetical protein
MDQIGLLVLIALTEEKAVSLLKNPMEEEIETENIIDLGRLIGDIRKRQVEIIQRKIQVILIL